MLFYYIIHFTFMTISLTSETSIPPPLSEELIALINSKNSSWKALKFFSPNATFDVMRRLAGTIMKDHNFKLIGKSNLTITPDLPQVFDARKNWHLCKSIRQIRNQGGCSSCWAVAAASTMTDRYCIHSAFKYYHHFSAKDLSSCCISNGCSKGGYISYAWQYMLHYGVVSGGSYKTDKGCLPYEIPPCTRHGCGNKTANLPLCKHACRSGYFRSYKKDKRFAKQVFAVKGGELQIKAEIFTYGPVEAVFLMYEDFLSYKSGVYRHLVGSPLGGHAVKIIGWGTENGVNYWLAANSWGSEWGEDGFFKIVRGENHCKIESLVMAGQPLLVGPVARTHLEFKFLNNIKVELEW